MGKVGHGRVATNWSSFAREREKGRMRTLLALLGVALAGVFALLMTTDGLRVFTTEEARQYEIAAAPIRLPVLRTLGSNGGPVPLIDPKRVTLLNFVYTRCTTICRTLGSEFQQLQSEILNRGLQNRVRLLSVSFDPEHDTAMQLEAYARQLRADQSLWQFATLADTTELPKLLSTFGIVVIPDGLGGFEHNAAIHVVDRQGWLLRIVDIANPKEALAIALEQAAAASPIKPLGGVGS